MKLIWFFLFEFLQMKFKWKLKRNSNFLSSAVNTSAKEPLKKLMGSFRCNNLTLRSNFKVLNCRFKRLEAFANSAMFELRNLNIAGSSKIKRPVEPLIINLGPIMNSMNTLNLLLLISEYVRSYSLNTQSESHFKTFKVVISLSLLKWVSCAAINSGGPQDDSSCMDVTPGCGRRIESIRNSVRNSEIQFAIHLEIHFEVHLKIWKWIFQFESFESKLKLLNSIWGSVRTVRSRFEMIIRLDSSRWTIFAEIQPFLVLLDQVSTEQGLEGFSPTMQEALARSQVWSAPHSGDHPRLQSSSNLKQRAAPGRNSAESRAQPAD